MSNCVKFAKHARLNVALGFHKITFNTPNLLELFGHILRNQSVTVKPMFRFFLLFCAICIAYFVAAGIASTKQLQTCLNLQSSEKDRSAQLFATKTMVTKRGP